MWAEPQHYLCLYKLRLYKKCIQVPKGWGETRDTWQYHYCKYRRSREWSCLEIDGELRLSGLKCAKRKPRALLMLRKWVPCKFLLFFLSLNIWFKVPFGTQERKFILFLKIYSFQLDSTLFNNSMRSVRNIKGAVVSQLCSLVVSGTAASTQVIKGRQKDQGREPENE